MKSHSLVHSLLTALLVLALAGLAGCASLHKKPRIQKPPGTDMADQSGDTAFQAFKSRLRKAIARRDIATLAPMMAPNFGYSWEPGGEGAGVFDYWNRNNLWPELDLVLREKFVPSSNFMVAPPEATFDPDYKGYRAGLQLVNGSWRFAYFVSAPPAAELAQ
ncbi:MAG: hypothetical protein NTZ46_04265 [Verrucomicrobia bacterium]|nr:hypothetical protein [Verrucomicrobiota bacterium]